MQWGAGYRQWPSIWHTDDELPSSRVPSLQRKMADAPSPVPPSKFSSHPLYSGPGSPQLISTRAATRSAEQYRVSGSGLHTRTLTQRQQGQRLALTVRHTSVTTLTITSSFSLAFMPSAATVRLSGRASTYAQSAIVAEKIHGHGESPPVRRVRVCTVQCRHAQRVPPAPIQRRSSAAPACLTCRPQAGTGRSRPPPDEQGVQWASAL